MISEGSDSNNGAAAPANLLLFVPREPVRFLGGWGDVIGLRGSGSYDYEIPETFVDPGFTILSGASPRRGGPVQLLGTIGMTAAGQAGWPMGVARRALDEILALAPGATRMTTASAVGTIADQQNFQRDFASHEAAVAAARALVHQAFGNAVAYTREHSQPLPVTSPEYLTLRQVTTYALRVCFDAVLFCYSAAGTRAVHSSPLERCVRDMLAGNQHSFYSDAHLARRTQGLLGLVA